MILERMGEVPLPAHAKPGGFDHAAVHGPRERLSVARTANDSLDGILIVRLPLIGGLMIIISTAVTAAVLTLGSAFVNESFAADACVAKTFETTLTKDACAKGGQEEAKEAWKKFMKEKNIKSCGLCHSKLAPSYPLKDDGLKLYRDMGGK